MTINSDADLEAMRRVGRLLAQTIEQMRAAVRPASMTGEIDRVTQRFARSAGARVVEAADGWTQRTHNHALAAHHEHTIVIRRGVPLVLTAA